MGGLGLSVPYLLEYKPGVLFPFWLLRLGFKMRLAFFYICSTMLAPGCLRGTYNIGNIYSSLFRTTLCFLYSLYLVEMPFVSGSAEAAAEGLHSFAHVIPSMTSKIVPPANSQHGKCHTPSEAPGLYLRPGFLRHWRTPDF